MQRKPQAPAEDKAPNPLVVVLVSLFGYPGAGHMMLGRKREGAIFATLFTVATLGVLYEISSLLPEILKLVRQSVDMEEALTIPQLPNLPRTGLWTILTGGIWMLCGAHSGIAASQAAREWRPKTVAAPESVPAEPLPDSQA